MFSQGPFPACRRCGICCQKGGPALHLEDLPLVRDGVLARAGLFTIRAGETVCDGVAGGLAELETEIVKIAPAGQGFACRFHAPEAQACRIHGTRPAECRALNCEDTREIEALYAVGRLTRAGLIGASGGLWELVVFHDASFPAGAAMDLARRAAAGSREALFELRGLAQAEDAFRSAFLERMGLAPAELDFYFGRSLRRICAPHGVKLGG